jgi:hypothetical protein
LQRVQRSMNRVSSTAQGGRKRRVARRPPTRRKSRRDGSIGDLFPDIGSAGLPEKYLLSKNLGANQGHVIDRDQVLAENRIAGRDRAADKTGATEKAPERTNGEVFAKAPVIRRRREWNPSRNASRAGLWGRL